MKSTKPHEILLHRDKTDTSQRSKFIKQFYLVHAGADPGFLERGSMCIKGVGLVLLIVSHFS